mgnify:FL=1
MIRVLIVDDQPSIRLGLTLQLRGAPGIEVVGVAADGQEALDLIGSGKADPEVVLMDVRMPRLDGIAATAQLAAAHPDVRVLILTTFDEDEAAFAALDAGASGFLLKDATMQQLVDAVAAVAHGDAVLAPRITRELLARADLNRHVQPREGDRRSAARALLQRLSERELEVLTAVGRGLTNAEIAETQHLAPSSVKTYISRLLTKLDRRDRVGLVILARDADLR